MASGMKIQIGDEGRAVFPNRGAPSYCVFQHILKNTIFKMSTNLKANCYWFRHWVQQIIFPCCRVPQAEKVGNTGVQFSRKNGQILISLLK